MADSIFELMFESYELPPPEAVADLDDLGLLDTMELATALETVAIDVQVAVMRELCRRQVRAAAMTRPTPSLTGAEQHVALFLHAIPNRVHNGRHLGSTKRFGAGDEPVGQLDRHCVG